MFNHCCIAGWNLVSCIAGWNLVSCIADDPLGASRRKRVHLGFSDERRCSRIGHENAKRSNNSKCHADGYLHLYKSMGQHILNNPRVLDTIVCKSAIKPTDTVLEIGPGTGNLTLKLLEVAKMVVAIEIDKRMVEVLNKRVSELVLADKLHIICEDALTATFPEFDLVVANIPYGISSPLLAKLFYGPHVFRSATLVLQKEFACRVLSYPGGPDYSRLAANMRLVAEVERVMNISKRDFLPSPRVDSSLVLVRPKAKPPPDVLVEWQAFTRVCFNTKNKTLRAILMRKKQLAELLRSSRITNMAAAGSCGPEDGGRFAFSSEIELRREVGEILKSSGFEKKRPSKMGNHELLHLLASFNRAGVYFHDQLTPLTQFQDIH